MALMARRLAAGLIDMAPLMVALLLVLPLLAVIGLQGYESLLGEGIFDPVSGGDPVIAVHLAGKRALAVGAALGALVWLAVEIQALLRRRQSIGTATAGLTLQRLDGRLPSVAQALVREGIRLACAVALVVAGALVAGPAAAVIGDSELPRRYAAPLVSPLTLALPVAILAAVLTLHLIVDFALALAGARSLADRLAGTRIHR